MKYGPRNLQNKKNIKAAIAYLGPCTPQKIWKHLNSIDMAPKGMTFTVELLLEQMIKDQEILYDGYLFSIKGYHE